jgi:hypothetical protein
MAKKQPMYGSEASTNNDAIADASVAHAFNGTFDDAEVEGACDALGTKINAIIKALENFGILKT